MYSVEQSWDSKIFYISTCQWYLSALFIVSHACHSIVLPQIHPFDFGEEPINSGELVSLTCAITKGDLPLTINWLYKNQSVSSLDGVIAKQVSRKTSNLEIDSVQAHHIGEYTCTATNQAGTSSYSAYLHVNGTVFNVLL